MSPTARIVSRAWSAIFKGARLNEKVADVAFQFDLPDEAKLVKRFARPPEPISKLWGQKIGNFEFVDLDGKPVTRESLAGKVVVIDFWATWCGWCFKGLPNLQRVYDNYRDNDRVAIVAVSNDDPKVTNDELRSSFQQAKLTIPILRDPQLQVQSMFQVESLPTMVLLGADGTVQGIEVAYQPHLAVELPRKLEKLLAGENLAAQVLEEQAQRVQSFEKGIEAGNPDNGEAAVIPQARIAPRSEPTTLPLKPAWHSDEVIKPGNILAVADGGQSRILVLDGMRNVVELDDRGQLAKRYELELPNDAAISFLRTGVDGEGARYFAGSASAYQHLFLFDSGFSKLLVYPTDGKHAGISDLRLADLDGDGKLDINVGFWGSVGVQSVSLAGDRRWSMRSLEDVWCLTVTGPASGGPRGLLASDGRGMLVPINAAGKEGSPLSLPGRFLRWVQAADLDGDGQDEYCCVASVKAGVEGVVALTSAGTLLWAYDLPVGAQTNPALEMITHGKLDGANDSWVVAGADGSVNILASDGKLLDRFCVGAAIQGLAVGEINGRGALLVATEQGVDAWQLEPAAQLEPAVQ